MNFRNLLTAFVLLQLYVAPVFAIETLKEADLAQLKQGKILVEEKPPATKDSKKRFVTAKILINKPIDTVWKSLQNQENLFNGDPHMKKVQVVGRPTPAQQLVEYTLLISRFLPTFIYTTHVNFNKNNMLVDFKRVKGSFKDFNGYTKLQPVENSDKTVMIYALQVDPGMPIPQFVIRSILKSELPQIVTRVRDVVQKEK